MDGRPYIINLMATSLDGRIARSSFEDTRTRQSYGFLGGEDAERLRFQISECDLVFIGARTLMSEKAAMRVKDLRSSGTEPEWVVFSSTGKIDPTHFFWKQTGFKRTICFCTSFDPYEASQVLASENEVDGQPYTSLSGNIAGILSHFSEKGALRVALLGGGILNGLFWNAKLVDAISITLGPRILGEFSQENVSCPSLLQGYLKQIPKLKLTQSHQSGDFVFLDYEVEHTF